ncbi:HNH endonuclease, partial [Streptomyces sp. NPDC055078]
MSTRNRVRRLRSMVGDRCAYCRRGFTADRHPTVDHIVPYSLFRTNRVGHLTLACHDCNHYKADRLPLSLALLILQSAHPTDHPTAPASTPAVHPAGPVFTGPAGWAGWLALARLAHLYESAARSAPDRVKLHRRRRAPNPARPSIQSTPTPDRSTRHRGRDDLPLTCVTTPVTPVWSRPRTDRKPPREHTRPTR